MEKSLYKISKTEKLCPNKCQGMAFTIYSDNTVKCLTCKTVSTIDDLLDDY